MRRPRAAEMAPRVAEENTAHSHLGRGQNESIKRTIYLSCVLVITGREERVPLAKPPKRRFVYRPGQGLLSSHLAHILFSARSGRHMVEDVSALLPGLFIRHLAPGGLNPLCHL